ncbi:heme exporter protein CcmD [Alteromonas facilis]|uniref:heme exporter protein CcmD n=1 Tax=Alteromonas facilis TaxID=2048004 RepID=UPI000C29007F|nr:heme exporter protein CcmD [Alteromonas facilis]
MQFNSFSEFFAMGGYAFFVWLSFGVTAIAMALIVIESHMARNKLLNLIVSEQARKQRIAAARSNQKSKEG